MGICLKNTEIPAIKGELVSETLATHALLFAQIVSFSR
jgi:hypothetical protein